MKLVILFLTFLAIIVLGTTGYYLITYAINIYKDLDEKVINLIYVAFIVGLIAWVFTSIVAKRLAQKFKNRAIFAKKVEVYNGFIVTWANLVRNNENDESDLSNLVNILESSEKEFMLLASAEVVRKYIELQSYINNPGEYVTTFGQLILEIRKDLGNSNAGLSSSDLASLVFDLSDGNEQQENDSANEDQEAILGVSNT